MAGMSFTVPAQPRDAQSVSAFPHNIPAAKMANYERGQQNTTMEILNAERYDDGSSASRRGNTTQRQGQQQQQGPILAFGLSMDDEQQRRGGTRNKNQTPRHQRPQSMERPAGDRRRKKQKLSDDEDGEDDASKKARGRPRLDTKDETAADRRRTQIRMAQRAYRHRKETTIASLEKQVQELRGANEEMSSIFLNLHDFALQRGILDREREFGSHLASSTQRFIHLAKSTATDDSAREDDANSADGKPETHSPEPEPRGRLRQTVPLPISQTEVSNADPHPADMWGYQMMKEDEVAEQRNPMDMPDLDLESFMRMPPPQGQHQIISRATPYNASFSFDTDNDFFQQFNADVPDVFEDFARNVAFQDTLPLPKTLSQYETTFSRHLHRAALEKGLELILNREASPVLLQRSFGLCLNYETLDKIEARLRHSLATTNNESMFNWKAPFVHLGGSGTYYPLDQDIGGSLMPKFQTGMSMGPFSPAVADFRKTSMLDEYRSTVPGFEGPWFDPNDVEDHLRNFGINIPPNVEFFTINLDVLALKDSPSPISLSDSAVSNSHSSPTTPTSPQLKFPGLITQNSSGSDTYLRSTDFAMTVQGNNDHSLDFHASFDDWNNAISIGNTKKAAPNTFDFTGPIFDSMGGSALDVTRKLPLKNGHLVTLSVTSLVEELLSDAVCLGRTPGFRPFNVDSAINRAISKSFSR